MITYFFVSHITVRRWLILLLRSNILNPLIILFLSFIPKKPPHNVFLNMPHDITHPQRGFVFLRRGHQDPVQRLRIREAAAHQGSAGLDSQTQVHPNSFTFTFLLCCFCVSLLPLSPSLCLCLSLSFSLSLYIYIYIYIYIFLSLCLSLSFSS